jgi:hypothetical protein
VSYPTDEILPTQRIAVEQNVDKMSRRTERVGVRPLRLSFVFHFHSAAMFPQIPQSFRWAFLDTYRNSRFGETPASTRINMREYDALIDV